jgi:hypothetical protein
VVLDDVSDYYLSAVAAPEAGTKVASNDGISLRLHTTGGNTCGSSQDRTFQSDGAVRPIAASEFRVIDRDGQCQTADTYLLKLTRQSDPTSSPAAWPVELRVMAAHGGTVDGGRPRERERDLLGRHREADPVTVGPRARCAVVERRREAVLDADDGDPGGRDTPRDPVGLRHVEVAVHERPAVRPHPARDRGPGRGVEAHAQVTVRAVEDAVGDRDPGSRRRRRHAHAPQPAC